MALRTLLLKKQRDTLNAQVEKLRAKNADFEKREKEIETALNEWSETSTQEERDATEEALKNYEAELEAHNREVSELEQKIADIDKEIRELEDAQPQPETEQQDKGHEQQARGGVIMTGNKRVSDLSVAEKRSVFGGEEVKRGLEALRQAAKEKRSVEGIEHLFTDEVLGLIQSETEHYSELYNYVNVRKIGGKGRLKIQGATAEAVWTETNGKINGIGMKFSGIEVDGYKVAAFISIPNPTLEDSFINLGTAVVEAIGEAIGLALDKAILFGTGEHMPLGIATAIGKDTAVKTSNIVTIAAAKKGIELFQEMVKVAGKCKHASGELLWVMNSTTANNLKAESLGVNANATIVAGMGNDMPVCGGKLVTREFVPENVIVMGYGKQYLLAERAGLKLDYSREVQYLEDNTVFKGTQRFDGKPIFNDSFAVVGLGKAPDVSTITFAEDTANKEAAA